jgi:hypothetical protein
MYSFLLKNRKMQGLNNSSKPKQFTKAMAGSSLIYTKCHCRMPMELEATVYAHIAVHDESWHSM